MDTRDQGDAAACGIPHAGCTGSRARAAHDQALFGARNGAHIRRPLTRRLAERGLERIAPGGSRRGPTRRSNRSATAPVLRFSTLQRSAESARRWAEHSRKWRWPVAFALALGAVAAAVAALYIDAAAICKDEVAGSRTVDVCSPPSVAQLALMFIPSLLLLLPDLSEVDVLGFGFKRDLDETKDKVDETEGTVTEQVEELGRAIARLEEGTADPRAVRELAETVERLAVGIRDLELTSARDTDVLRATLETLVGIDERVARLERGVTREST